MSFLLPDADSVWLYHKQSPLIAVHFGMSRKVIHQTPRERWNYFRVISHLEGDDPPVSRRWVHRNIGEIAIQRYQDSTQLLSLRNDGYIIGIRSNVLSQDENIMPRISKHLDD